jgi:hypothetical protein
MVNGIPAFRPVRGGPKEDHTQGLGFLVAAAAVRRLARAVVKPGDIAGVVR